MTKRFTSLFYPAIFLFSWHSTFAQPAELPQHHLVWNSQSQNAMESMPCGGGDVGLNLWVEKGELLVYLARSGTFDQNNTLLKLGRVRVRLSPNPFADGSTFRQELVLNDGHVQIDGATAGLSAQVRVWVDVFRPVVHLDVTANKAIKAEATYENWRYANRITKGRENNANSYKWAPQGEVKMRKDSIQFAKNQVVFYHENGKGPSVFG